MVQWEYRTVEAEVTNSLLGANKVDLKSLDRKLNLAGYEGWELVSATNLNEGFGATRCVYYTLKRQVP